MEEESWNARKNIATLGRLGDCSISPNSCYSVCEPSGPSAGRVSPFVMPCGNVASAPREEHSEHSELISFRTRRWP